MAKAINPHRDYFQAATPSRRKRLKAIQALVESLLPDVERCFSYRMPAYKGERIFFYFAAFKEHIGIYPPLKKDKRLIKELAPYRGPKGNLSFSLDEELPLELIGRVAVALYKEYGQKPK
jgi:uncharacterized protein YdhG (YjbR/CyaY superfamily)